MEYKIINKYAEKTVLLKCLKI